MAVHMVNGRKSVSKWNQGDKVGRFTVTETPRYFRHHKRHSRCQWWYVGTCECGSVDVERSQADLREGRGYCETCARKRSNGQPAAVWYRPQDLPDCPDFSRLRLVSNEMLAVLEEQ